MRIHLLLLAPLLALGACSDSPREDAAPAPESAPGSEPAPEAGEEDCGAYVVTFQNMRARPPDRIEKQQCLLDAFAAGEPAHLDVESPTVEGDPIYHRYTVVGPEIVEVRTDTTHDRFGSPGIITERCTSLVLVEGHLRAAACTAV